MAYEAESHRVQCSCLGANHNKDHVVDLDYWRDDEYGDLLTISTGLAHYKGFFGRLWVAVKYVLGIDNTYCFYIETVVDKAELLRLKSYIDKVSDQYSDSPRDLPDAPGEDGSSTMT